MDENNYSKLAKFFICYALRHIFLVGSVGIGNFRLVVQAKLNLVQI